jgi:4-hydroxy-tetrahydrodipicolinate synthase
MSLGGNGVISVLSNLLPEKMASYVEAAGDPTACSQFLAQKWHFDHLALMEAMFLDGEPNPQAIKTALELHHDWFGEAHFRSPMVQMDPANKQRLADILRAYQLI